MGNTVLYAGADGDGMYTRLSATHAPGGYFGIRKEAIHDGWSAVPPILCMLNGT